MIILLSWLGLARDFGIVVIAVDRFWSCWRPISYMKVQYVLSAPHTELALELALELELAQTFLRTQNI